MSLYHCSPHLSSSTECVDDPDPGSCFESDAPRTRPRLDCSPQTRLYFSQFPREGFTHAKEVGTGGQEAQQTKSARNQGAGNGGKHGAHASAIGQSEKRSPSEVTRAISPQMSAAWHPAGEFGAFPYKLLRFSSEQVRRWKNASPKK